MINKIIKQISKEDFGSFLDIIKNYIGESELNSAIKHFDKFNDLFLGYYINKRLVGIIFGHIKDDEAIIDAIAVLKDFWKKGIGKKLIYAFESIAKEKGIKTSSVGAALNPINVVNFYKKCGYHIIKKKKDFWIMEKNL